MNRIGGASGCGELRPWFESLSLISSSSSYYYCYYYYYILLHGFQNKTARNARGKMGVLYKMQVTIHKVDIINCARELIITY